MKKGEAILKLTGTIKSNTFLYDDEKWKERVNEFKQINEGYDFNVIFESTARPEHFQFKYLYGYLYPAIAEGMGLVLIENEKRRRELYGENNTIETPGVLEADRICKEKFLMFPVIDEKEIPGKYRSRCEKFYTTAEVLNEETGEVKTINQIYAYIPSKAVLSFREMSEYISKCEHLRDENSGWDVPADKIKDMMTTRLLAMSKGTVIDKQEIEDLKNQTTFPEW